jgi:phosphate acetyltransferase
VRAGLPEVVGDDLVAAALPEAPILAAPTVAEVAQALGARYLQSAGSSDGGAGALDDGAHREVGRLVVGAMGLEHFLERIVDGDLVITRATAPTSSPAASRRTCRGPTRRSPAWCSPAG